MQPEQQTQPSSQPKRSLRTWFAGLSRTGKIRLVTFVIALLVAPFAIYMGLDEPNQAEAGDCMVGQSASTLRIVECEDPGAQWKVLARLEGKTQADHTDSACREHPDTEVSFFQDGRRFRKGFILCLGAAGK